MTGFLIGFIWLVAGLFGAVIFGRFCIAGRGDNHTGEAEPVDVDALAKLEIEKLRQQRYRRAG